MIRRNVRSLVMRGDTIEVVSGADTIVVSHVIICAGAWSAALLAPFGLKVPMEAARGYHVEMPGATPLIDAPILYQDQATFVTPMAGRLRSTSFMEFGGLDAPPDPRHPAQLRRTLIALGYPADALQTSWVGPRPVLPDYLPAIGRVPGVPNLLYAFGHQHIGLTLSAMTARTVADLVAAALRRRTSLPSTCSVLVNGTQLSGGSELMTSSRGPLVDGVTCSSVTSTVAPGATISLTLTMNSGGISMRSAIVASGSWPARSG